MGKAEQIVQALSSSNFVVDAMAAVGTGADPPCRGVWGGGERGHYQRAPKDLPWSHIRVKAHHVRQFSRN